MGQLERRAVLVLATLMLAAPAPGDGREGVRAYQAGRFEQAVTHWRPLAQAGDAEAQYNLGQAYRLGKGVPRDLNAAERWLGLAAAQGLAPAIEAYGLVLFQNGKGVMAVPYLERAVANGSPRAQYVLGTMLFNGDFLAKDWARAYALMLRAADAGLPPARASLAQMLPLLSVEERERGEMQARQSAASTAPLMASRGGPAAAKAPPPSIQAQNAPKSQPQPPSSPPQPAARPLPAPPASAGSSWRIQLGAFGTAAAAQGQWQAVQARVPSLAGHQPIYEAAGAMTRLRVGPLRSRAEAQALCRDAKAVGAACFVVAP